MVPGDRPRGRRGNRPISEINVTPFVDVMLVLLIVFMVTAPLLTVGVPVDLPQTQATQLSDDSEPLVVSIDGQGRIFVQETEVDLDTLAPRIEAIRGARADTAIYVRGDRAIDYGRVMAVMGTLNSAGFDRVSLVAEFAQDAAAAPVRTGGR
ncbi:MAG: protein TolR [Alphaproteobacteria bacterium]